MVRLSAIPAVGVAVAAPTDRLAALAGATVTDRPVPLLMDPSVTTTDAVSTLTSFMTPLLEPETVDTPLVKVRVSLVPKATRAPLLSDTVGTLPPTVLAPVNLIVFLSPVYPVA